MEVDKLNVTRCFRFIFASICFSEVAPLHSTLNFITNVQKEVFKCFQCFFSGRDIV
jgi:hypothetical protein